MFRAVAHASSIATAIATALAAAPLAGCSDSEPERTEPSPRPAAVLPPGDVAVSFDAPTGEAASVFRAGVTAFHWNTAWNVAAELSEPYRRSFFDHTRPGLVHIEVEWPQASASAAPAEAELTTALADSFARVGAEAFAAGGGLMVRVPGPPRWASSAPDETGPIVPGQNDSPIWSRSPASPAQDFAAWSLAIRALATALRDSFPTEIEEGRLYLAYGGELNNEEIYGPLDAYTAGFDRFAREAKAVAASIHVGGGGSSNPWGVKEQPAAYATTQPALRLWLDGCGAAGCPLDFVYFHSFTASPVRWGEAQASTLGDFTDVVAAWQTAAGYPAAERIVTDWTTWEFGDSGTGAIPDHPWLSSEEDTEYRAAYVAAALVEMRRLGYRHHTFGALFETTGLPGEFIGDWGLLTNAGLGKPALNAFAMAGAIADGDLVQIEAAGDLEPFVFAEAATVGSDARVLVARFVPDVDHGRRMLLRALAFRLSAAGFDAAALCAAGICDESTAARVVTTHDLTGLSMPDPMSRIFTDWFSHDDAATQAPQTLPVRLTIHRHPRWSRLTRYRTSAEANNTYAFCVRQAHPCADVAAVNAALTGLVPVSEEPKAIEEGDSAVELELERRDVQLLVFE